MKKSELLFFRMVESVLAYLNNSVPQWQSVPGMEAQVKTITQRHAQAMSVAGNVENLDQSAYTRVKKAKFTQLINSVLVICKRVDNYALQTNNTVLHQLVNHTRTSLSNGMEEEAIVRCRGILEKAGTMPEALAPFLVDAALINASFKLIDEFNGMVDARTNVKLNKIAGINDITAQKAALTTDLKLLDNMVYGYITDAEFTNAYKTVRKPEPSRARKQNKTDDHKNSNGNNLTTA